MSETTPFGDYVRERREALRSTDRRYSVRQVAARVGIQPSYLSKIERGEQPPPSEATIRALAADLTEDADLLLALAGKVSADLQAIIRKRPLPENLSVSPGRVVPVGPAKRPRRVREMTA